MTADDRRRAAILRARGRGWRELALGYLEIWLAGLSHGSGTRASANTSGPDFMEGFEPDEIADQRSAPNEESWFLLPDRFSQERALSKGRSSRLT
jgi:hypothetical protein